MNVDLVLNVEQVKVPEHNIEKDIKHINYKPDNAVPNIHLISQRSLKEVGDIICETVKKRLDRLVFDKAPGT